MLIRNFCAKFQMRTEAMRAEYLARKMGNVDPEARPHGRGLASVGLATKTVQARSGHYVYQIHSFFAYRPSA